MLFQKERTDAPHGSTHSARDLRRLRWLRFGFGVGRFSNQEFATPETVAARAVRESLNYRDVTCVSMEAILFLVELGRLGGHHPRQPPSAQSEAQC
jgi:hypothetical protein